MELLPPDAQTRRGWRHENDLSGRQMRDAAGFRSDNELCWERVNPPCMEETTKPLNVVSLKIK